MSRGLGGIAVVVKTVSAFALVSVVPEHVGNCFGAAVGELVGAAVLVGEEVHAVRSFAPFKAKKSRTKPRRQDY
jgi:hypothetical protein